MDYVYILLFALISKHMTSKKYMFRQCFGSAIMKTEIDLARLIIEQPELSTIYDLK